MTRWRVSRGWTSGIGCVLGVLLLGGCESRTSETVPTPATAPASVASDDAEPEATTRPADPELPEYLALVSRFDEQAEVTVNVLDASGRRLELDTRNVQRLRIERDKLPLQTERSIVLVLDEQVFEWRANSEVTEFERSANGAWQPVKPGPAE